MKALAFCVVAGLAIVGCSNKDSGSRTASNNDSNPSIGSDIDGTPGIGKPMPRNKSNDENPSNETPDPTATKDPKVMAPIEPSLPEPKPVQKPGSGHWRATKLTIPMLAANLAKSMSSVQGVEGRAVLASKTPEGNGTNIISYRFATPNTFRVDYVEPGLIPKRSTIVSNGTAVRAYAQNRWTSPRPIAKGFDPTRAKVDPQKFITNFSRAMLGNAVDKTDPWAPLFSELQSGKAGFDARIEERLVLAEGRTYVSYRIVAERSRAAAAKLGPASMEIVIDQKYWLPVTIRTEMTPPGQKPWSYEWAGAWRFKQKFTIDDLQLNPKRAIT